MTSISSTSASNAALMSSLSTVSSLSSALSSAPVAGDDSGSATSSTSATSGTASSPGSASTAGTGLISGTLTTAQQGTLSILSSLLGTTPAALMEQVRSGTSLVGLLNQSGVSSSSLSNDSVSGLLFDATA